MQGLNQEEQLQVNGFKSILQSSYDLWTTPTPSGGSYLPTGAMDYQIIAMADAAGARRGYYNDWSPGTTGAAEADERAANCSAAASVAAGGRP